MSRATILKKTDSLSVAVLPVSAFMRRYSDAAHKHTAFRPSETNLNGVKTPIVYSGKNEYVPRRENYKRTIYAKEKTTCIRTSMKYR